MGIGCGAQLCLKFVRSVVQKDVIAISNSMKNHITEDSSMIFLDNPIPSGMVSIIDNKTAERFLPTLLKNKSFIVCCNQTPQQRFTRMLGLQGGYSATASLAFQEDLISKLTKMHALQGPRYLEVLTPCPREWGYDTSNTVDIARSATETGIWPLFEMDNFKTRVGKRPEKLGLLETFHNLQKKFIFEQKAVEDNWKRLVEASLK